MAGLGDQTAFGPDMPVGEREDYGPVVIEHRLCQALQRLNPWVPADAMDEAFRMLTRPDDEVAFRDARENDSVRASACGLFQCHAALTRDVGRAKGETVLRGTSRAHRLGGPRHQSWRMMLVLRTPHYFSSTANMRHQLESMPLILSGTANR